MRLWLDDQRPAPEGWISITTAPGAILLLQATDYEVISLDHDLGPDRLTGYAVLIWLEEKIATGCWDRPVPEIRIHSANPVGRARMLQAVASIQKLRNSNE